MFNRRDNLKLTLGVAASLTIARGGAPCLAGAAEAAERPFELPLLSYGYEALEPTIDALTMTIHHDRHHGAYVDALNKIAEQYPALATKPPAEWLTDLSRIPEAFRTPVRNNLGGHWNHSFFWDLMTPGGAKGPQGDLKASIDQAFGSQAKLIEAINAAGLARFGSGWAWLVIDRDHKLAVLSTPNQDTPLEQSVRRVVLGVDVWEHAYYLKYHYRRADYLAAWWNVVNWDKAQANFAKAPV